MSEPAAREMAVGAATALGADVGCRSPAWRDRRSRMASRSVPSGSGWRPARPEARTARRMGGGGDRDQIRQIATISALDSCAATRRLGWEASETGPG